VPSQLHLTPCTPSKSNLYLANSLASAVNKPALYRLLTFQVTNLMSLFLCLGRTKLSVQGRGFVCEYFVRFNGEELLVPRPTPQIEDYPFSTVRDYLFYIFATTLHVGGLSSIRNLTTRHAIVTGTHLSHG